MEHEIDPLAEARDYMFKRPTKDVEEPVDLTEDAIEEPEQVEKVELDRWADIVDQFSLLGWNGDLKEEKAIIRKIQAEIEAYNQAFKSSDPKSADQSGEEVLISAEMNIGDVDYKASITEDRGNNTLQFVITPRKKRTVKIENPIQLESSEALESEQAISESLDLLDGQLDPVWVTKAMDSISAKVAEHNQKNGQPKKVKGRRIMETSIKTTKCEVDGKTYDISLFKDLLSNNLRVVAYPPLDNLWGERDAEETESVALVKTPEQAIAKGENKSLKILEDVRAEGELALFRFFQAVDRATGREKHPEILRKLLLEFRKPITSLAVYREMTQETVPNLIKGLELLYGTVSFGLRGLLKDIFSMTGYFEGRLGELSEKAYKKLENAKTLYKVDDDTK